MEIPTVKLTKEQRIENKIIRRKDQLKLPEVADNKEKAEFFKKEIERLEKKKAKSSKK